VGAAASSRAGRHAGRPEDRPLRRGPPDRRRWHGRGLRRARSAARSRRRDQATAPRRWRDRRRQGCRARDPAGAPVARGAGDGAAQSSQRGLDLRGRDRGRHRVSRDGARRRPDAEGLARRIALARGDPARHPRRRCRARRRARGGRDPPRLQARQRPPRQGRSRAGLRLRARPRRRCGAGRAGRSPLVAELARVADHAERLARRHAGVHGTRAARRRAPRRAHRSVQLLCRALRGAVRRASVRQLRDRAARSSGPPRGLYRRGSAACCCEVSRETATRATRR
jgi:hypothetical protein